MLETERDIVLTKKTQMKLHTNYYKIYTVWK